MLARPATTIYFHRCVVSLAQLILCCYDRSFLFASIIYLIYDSCAGFEEMPWLIDASGVRTCPGYTSSRKMKRVDVC